jgi:hypothetical protein
MYRSYTIYSSVVPHSCLIFKLHCRQNQHVASNSHICFEYLLLNRAKVYTQGNEQGNEQGYDEVVGNIRTGSAWLILIDVSFWCYRSFALNVRGHPSVSSPLLLSPCLYVFPLLTSVPSPGITPKADDFHTDGPMTSILTARQLPRHRLT